MWVSDLAEIFVVESCCRELGRTNAAVLAADKRTPEMRNARVVDSAIVFDCAAAWLLLLK